MRNATLVSFLILYQTESHTHTERGMEDISALKPIPRVCFQQQVVQWCSSQYGGHSCVVVQDSLPTHVPGWGWSTGKKDFDECQTGINTCLSLGLNFTNLRNIWEKKKHHSHESTLACKIAVCSQVPQLPSAAGAKHNHVVPEKQQLSQKKCLLPSSTGSRGTGIILSLSWWTKPYRLDLHW